ncbi:radical SAM protein [Thermodesulfobacteriota bacterium]
MCPSYFQLYDSGELRKRVISLYKILLSCTLCPRKCGVNRIIGEQGFCKSGFLPKVASNNVHKGEEPPISGTNGSGTIFFSSCTLSCDFCQNFPISQLGTGKEVTVTDLADMMIRLQKKGCHNINFVTPTHFVPQIVHALLIATRKGFSLPVVYNASGYESLEVLKLLDGIVDIYLPDMKYDDDKNALKYSHVSGYKEINRIAIKEMHRQVGVLQTDENNIAVRGLIIRHLVLPDGLSGSKKILDYIKENLGNDTYISLMSQYFPAHRAVADQALSKKIGYEEYSEIVEYLEKLGFSSGWTQNLLH